MFACSGIKIENKQQQQQQQQLWACDIIIVVVVVYSYFLYCNKQTSAKIWWAFEVIMLPPQSSIYISKIKSNNSSEI